MALPQLGLTQEVRVCGGCFAKNILDKRDKVERVKLDDNALSFFTNSEVRVDSSTHGANNASPSSVAANSAPRRQEAGDDFDADLKKAIELSLKEEGQRKGYGSGYAPPAAIKKSEPPKPKVSLYIYRSICLIRPVVVVRYNDFMSNFKITGGRRRSRPRSCDSSLIARNPHFVDGVELSLQPEFVLDCMFLVL